MCDGTVFRDFNMWSTSLYAWPARLFLTHKVNILCTG